MSVSTPVDIPDAGDILSRWHALGHPDVPLDDVRRVRQLPTWMLLRTPGSLKDLAAVRLALGMSTDAGGA
ncbi:MAG: hypothetical protein Q8O40_15935 [Chloroflexota bacterium]|nr:hypothetical protein [Chloroflexota bacterium]